MVDEYGYSKTDIGVEVSISMGRARKSCDLVIYRAATPHVQENIVTIVEAKREGIKPSDVDSGVEQLKSYMAACSSCKFGLWVGQERQAYSRNVSDGSISSVEAVSKIER
ncbi:MAG: type I restriction enzyme HsdR N-terminal domain-containing protein [Chloroflexi bacterium]|nr:type I restriction enzyme HsdR N-terminal domain-containing protein [Chloroflexota bacterium]